MCQYLGHIIGKWPITKGIVFRQMFCPLCPIGERGLGIRSDTAGPRSIFEVGDDLMCPGHVRPHIRKGVDLGFCLVR